MRYSWSLAGGAGVLDHLALSFDELLGKDGGVAAGGVEAEVAKQGRADVDG